jgi:serine/threonine-protein kinase
VLPGDAVGALGAESALLTGWGTAGAPADLYCPSPDSGTADGFLYYVMPFIDGETLRTRLDRETQLGIDEAVNITTAVADALAHMRRVRFSFEQQGTRTLYYQQEEPE